MKSPIDLSLIKKHPVETGLVVVGVGLVIFLFAGGLGGGSASAASSSGTTAADLQVLQIQAQLQGQDSAQAFQLQALALQNQGTQATNLLSFTLQEDQLSAASQNASQSLAAQVALTKYTTDAATTQQNNNLNAEMAIQANNNATYLAQQQQINQEQMFAIGAQTSLQALISQNQTLVATTQIGAGVQIAQITADEQKYIANQQAQTAQHSSNNGLLGGIIGGLFSFL